jgi:hypothetical protein
VQGIGGVLLPKPMGLNEEASNKTTQTKILTISLYLLGGIVASAANGSFTAERRPEKQKIITVTVRINKKSGAWYGPAFLCSPGTIER